MTCIMMIGIAGSGKSTIADRLVAQSKQSGIEIALCSSDEMRECLFGDAACQNNPQRVFAALHKEIFEHLAQGTSVIYDATNLRANKRKEFITRIKERFPSCVIIGYLVDTDPKTAIERQKLRERKVPEDVIQRQWIQLEMPTTAEGFDIIYSDKCGYLN